MICFNILGKEGVSRVSSTEEDGSPKAGRREKGWDPLARRWSEVSYTAQPLVSTKKVNHW